PSHLTDQFILGVPDVDSWFLLRLHLTEVPPQRAEVVRDRKTVSVAEARALAKRYWNRAHAEYNGRSDLDRTGAARGRRADVRRSSSGGRSHPRESVRCA